jgi:hypothetical protein
MISGSKTGPKGHVCVFNANIFTQDKKKIWFGDLDLDADKKDLMALAAKRGQAIFVLREMDGRFMNEAAPKMERAVAVYRPDGSGGILDDGC